MTRARLLCCALQVDMLLAPTAPPAPGDTCCTPPPPADGSTAIVHPPSPLEKDFEGVRDVNVSVALMEEFMQCAFLHDLFRFASSHPERPPVDRRKLLHICVLVAMCFQECCQC